MNEAHCIEASAQATDRFMELICADAAYVEAGNGDFTAENHASYLDEFKTGDRRTITTLVLKGEGKKMHLFNRLLNAEGAGAATVETLLLHVDLKTRHSSFPTDAVLAKLEGFAKQHTGMPSPENAGMGIAS